MKIIGNITLDIEGLNEIYEFKIYYYCKILELPDYCRDILTYIYNAKEEKSITDLCIIFSKKYKISKEIIRRKLRILANNFIIGTADRYKEDGTKYKTYIINPYMINDDDNYYFFVYNNDYSGNKVRREYIKEQKQRLSNIVNNKEHRGIKNAGSPVEINKKKTKKVYSDIKLNFE